ncbi:MAG TPA: hypothetical protein VKU00_22325, partial [Chthonomonadaceae bacterium]|nr:hypothetical protein [Chthonomonadaceae bacterium]
PAPGGGTSNALTFTVLPPTLKSLTLSPTKVHGGQSATGTVTLTAPAISDTVVTLTNNNTQYATVPTSVTVSKGSKTATFSITTNSITFQATAKVTAILNGVKKSATLTITP